MHAIESIDTLLGLAILCNNTSILKIFPILAAPVYQTIDPLIQLSNDWSIL